MSDSNLKIPDKLCVKKTRKMIEVKRPGRQKLEANDNR